eukprot:1395234-Amorphochlora_amoeboformis.AAC.2
MIDPNEESISVSIRVRPLNERELKQNQYVSWETDRAKNSLVQLDDDLNKMKGGCFSYDRVFAAEASTEEVYTSIAQPVIQSALEGVNGTIFAYGQTSSGKTYSMSGIIRQAVAEIFARITETPDRKYTVKMSHMEIYNEVIIDLMNPHSGSLKVHEDLTKGIYVGNLTEVEVDEAKVFQILRETEKNRTVGKTAMNKESSRSHSILRIVISSEHHQFSEGKAGLQASLNMVDLAGSERCSQTKSQGLRLKVTPCEYTNIS